MDNIQMTAWANGYDELSALLRRYPVAYSTADGQVFQNSCTKIKQDR